VGGRLSGRLLRAEPVSFEEANRLLSAALLRKIRRLRFDFLSF